jgi:hypothetical protein
MLFSKRALQPTADQSLQADSDAIIGVECWQSARIVRWISGRLELGSNFTEQGEKTELV